MHRQRSLEQRRGGSAEACGADARSATDSADDGQAVGDVSDAFHALVVVWSATAAAGQDDELDFDDGAHMCIDVLRAPRPSGHACGPQPAACGSEAESIGAARAHCSRRAGGGVCSWFSAHPTRRHQRTRAQRCSLLLASRITESEGAAGATLVTLLRWESRWQEVRRAHPAASSDVGRADAAVPSLTHRPACHPRGRAHTQCRGAHTRRVPTLPQRSAQAETAVAPARRCSPAPLVCCSLCHSTQRMLRRRRMHDVRRRWSQGGRLRTGRRVELGSGCGARGRGGRGGCRCGVRGLL